MTRDRRDQSSSQIVIASNRGPVSFVRDGEGHVEAKRGGGGLVTALTGALRLWGGLWIASAMSEEDRRQARSGRLEVSPEEGGRYRVRYLAFDRSTYDGFYNGISNEVLWFVHHCLWDTARQPRFEAGTRRAWEDYRTINRAFAAALYEEGSVFPGGSPAYLVQDYHLALVPAMLRQLQPQARIAQFFHIPFAGPSYLAILPTDLRMELLSGLLGADVVGFHAGQWAQNFLLCCRSLPGARVDLRRSLVVWKERRVRVRVNPISVDVEALQAEARSIATERARRRIERWKGQNKLILRVDRTDLSKNILRGLLAHRALLTEHRGWRGKVRLLALLNPSRLTVPEYRRYLRECLRTARRINDELGDSTWEPIRISVKDDHRRALAAYSAYDVLLVNPVFDGMNLVAKEGPLLNRRDGVLVLSENAGAFPELGDHALGVNPFDVGATAEALDLALRMSPSARARLASGLRQAVLRNPLDRWVKRQLDDLAAARQGELAEEA